MYKLRPKDERGKTETFWLDSSHTFSFADYYDPYNMGFSDLRVINDDIVAPDGGFSLHRHDDMEIISVVLSGELEHKDNLGHTSIIKRGDVQVMTAGTGILHSEYNPSSVRPVHFLQIWIMPEKRGLKPRYEQRYFKEEKMLNKLCLLVSKDGRDGSLMIHQDAFVYQMILEEHKNVVNIELDPERKYWIQIAEGAIEANSQILVAGDGLGIEAETGFIELKGVNDTSNLLLFDLPE